MERPVWNRLCGAARVEQPVWSADVPPRVMLQISVVDHLLPDDHLHGNRFIKDCDPRQSSVGDAVQLAVYFELYCITSQASGVEQLTAEWSCW